MSTSMPAIDGTRLHDRRLRALIGKTVRATVCGGLSDHFSLALVKHATRRSAYRIRRSHLTR